MIPRRARVVAAIGLFALLGTALAPTASADPQDKDLGKASDHGVKAPTRGPVDLVPKKWLIEVQGSAVNEGGNAATIKKAQQQVEANLTAAGIKVKVSASFTDAWNGISVQMDDSHADAARSVAGVTGVYPVAQVPRPETKTLDPKMASALSLTGADIAQSELGYTGKGIKVGIVDSGIDYNHPDLGGTGVKNELLFPTKRVPYGYDFVGDAYQAGTGSVPQPDKYPDDCRGHGTHVAGIVGANGDFSKGGVRGVAPDVTFGAYRVFGCSGSTDTEILLKAMERAGKDRMDIVNMSLGSAFESWPSYPTAKAADSLTRKGVIVVVSAGNEGTDGTFATGDPAVSKSAITVASVENSNITTPSFKITPDGSSIGYSNAEGSQLAPMSGSLNVVAAGAQGTTAALGCEAIPKVGANTAILIDRGGCTFRDKAVNAVAAGAAGVVLANNAPGIISPTVEGTPPIAVPVVMITQEDGIKLHGLLAQRSVTLNWTDQTVVVPNSQVGLVSEFSSYGMAANLSLKPDVTAPGGNIWSTYPLELNGYSNQSGTSMAAPHVSGAVALLLQARPYLKRQPAIVKTLVQNTADPIKIWSLNPDVELPEPVIRQGAGVIDVDEMITTRTVVFPSKIDLGEGERGPVKKWITITNTSRKPVTYDVSALDAIAVGGATGNPGFDYSPASFTSSRQRVTVPAYSIRLVQVTIGQPALSTGWMYGGWIVLKSTAEQKVIPFGGIYGDYQAVKVLTDQGIGLPALGKVVPDGYDLADPNQVYTMANGDMPVLMFHLEYPISSLKVRAYKANADGTKGAPVNRKVPVVISHDKLGRDPSFLAMTWDGTYPSNRGKGAKMLTAPDGRYILELTITKALGNERNPKHTETFTTPAFTISRSN